MSSSPRSAPDDDRSKASDLSVVAGNSASGGEGEGNYAKDVDATEKKESKPASTTTTTTTPVVNAAAVDVQQPRTPTNASLSPSITSVVPSDSGHDAGAVPAENTVSSPASTNAAATQDGGASASTESSSPATTTSRSPRLLPPPTTEGTGAPSGTAPPTVPPMNLTPRQKRKIAKPLSALRPSSIALSRQSSLVGASEAASGLPAEKPSPSSATAETRDTRETEEFFRVLKNFPLPKPRRPSKCPLYCVFYAEFDNHVGPKVCYQSPQSFMDGQQIDMPDETVHGILSDTFKSLKADRSTVTCSSPDQQRLPGGSPDPPVDSEAVDPRRRVDQQKEGATALPRKDTVASLASAASVEEKDTIFDSCSEYIITGNELTGNMINLSTHQIHVLTRPTIISDEKYERNSLLFCVGFVLRRSEDPRPFRPVLSKLANTFREMEIESQYLSNQKTRKLLQSHLDRILVCLNSPACECNLPLSPSNVLHLKLFHPPKLPALPVREYSVPILLRRDRHMYMVCVVGCRLTTRSR